MNIILPLFKLTAEAKPTNNIRATNVFMVKRSNGDYCKICPRHGKIIVLGHKPILCWRVCYKDKLI